MSSQPKEKDGWEIGRWREDGREGEEDDGSIWSWRRKEEKRKLFPAYVSEGSLAGRADGKTSESRALARRPSKSVESRQRSGGTACLLRKSWPQLVGLYFHLAEVGIIMLRTEWLSLIVYYALQSGI